MDYAQVVEKVGPCGLDCSRCAGFAGGDIKTLSSRLLELLGNYKRLAAIRAKHEPQFEHYDSFEAILKDFAAASCSGCRGDNDTCPINCVAKTCHKTQKVNFCFECGKFPCEDSFEGPLRDRWLKNGNRMKEIGAVAYYVEQSKLPRY